MLSHQATRQARVVGTWRHTDMARTWTQMGLVALGTEELGEDVVHLPRLCGVTKAAGGAFLACLSVERGGGGPPLEWRANRTVDQLRTGWCACVRQPARSSQTALAHACARSPEIIARAADTSELDMT
jgi:hypothetical protein